MKAFTVILALAGAVAAQPTLAVRNDFQCTDLLYSVAQCCATDVLGVADLDCETPSSTDTSSCAATGKQAKCCTIPLAGLGVLCTDV